MKVKDRVKRIRQKAFTEYQTTHFLAKEPLFNSGECHEYVEIAIFKAGIREVVEAVINIYGDILPKHTDNSRMGTKGKRWQAKLKDWGINEAEEADSQDVR